MLNAYLLRVFGSLAALIAVVLAPVLVVGGALFALLLVTLIWLGFCLYAAFNFGKAVLGVRS